jgi:hypothetical protein
MGRLQYIPSFYFYKFADAVSGPFTSLQAYRSGLIDADGNIIGNESSIDSFEYFVIKLKKIFDQLPPGMTRYKLSNLIGTMQVFSESVKNIGISAEEFNMLVEAEILTKSNGEVSYLQLLEDMGTTVGGGAGEAGGLGIPADAPQANKGGVSGYDPRMGGILTRAEPVNMIGAVEMFNVTADEFRLFKASRYYPKTSTGNYIRRFGHRNPGAKIAVRNEETGEVFWLPKAVKKSIVEEFNLNFFLNYLNEKNNAFDDAAKAVTSTFDNSKIERIHSGKINQDDAEEYGRAAIFLSSLGNLNSKIADSFLDKTIKLKNKPVSSTDDDAVGIDEKGKMFIANVKNARATYGTRGVSRAGFPENLVTQFYKAKQDRSVSGSEREKRKAEAEMKRIRDQAREWSEPPQRQRALQSLITQHIENIGQPTLAVTPHENPLLIPHKGIIKHVMAQPARVVLGLIGQGGRPEPQAQIGGSELARSRSGMEKLRKNIGLVPKHVVPDQRDFEVAKANLNQDIYAKLVHIVTGKKPL